MRFLVLDDAVWLVDRNTREETKYANVMVHEWFVTRCGVAYDMFTIHVPMAPPSFLF